MRNVRVHNQPEGYADGIVDWKLLAAFGMFGVATVTLGVASVLLFLKDI